MEPEDVVRLLDLLEGIRRGLVAIFVVLALDTMARLFRRR